MEEVLALEKADIHFESMQIVRAVVHGRVKLVKTECSEDELPLNPDLAVILLDWIRQTEDEARRESEDNMIEVIESNLLLSARSPGDTSMRRQSARTTSVLPVAALWGVRSAELKRAIGARPTFPCPTANAFLCTTRDGTRPGSTGASAGIPSATRTALGWTKQGHRWECSRSSCGTPKSRPR